MTGSSSAENVRWDVLVCSIEQRTERLARLLAELERQHRPGVGVLVYRDDRERRYGEKCQALVEASDADYVCFVDDDDWIDGRYVELVLGALKSRPDYVGFRVRISEDGELRTPATHSLAHGAWHETPQMLYRGISHLNPIRRDLALLGDFATAETTAHLVIDGEPVIRHEIAGLGCERVWAEQIRTSGRCRREVFIDRELYHYRHSSTDGFLSRGWQTPPDQPTHVR